MRTTIYGKESLSGKTLHIDEVKKDLNLRFICGECGNPLIPVKTLARGKDWHFRHPANSNIAKCRQTGLHDYVQQLLLEQSTITIAQGCTIEYSNQKKEQWLENLYRSDVYGIHDNLPVHFEIVVTSDLSDEKLKYFIGNKIRCVRIDLSDKKYLIMPRDIISDLVLNRWENKSLYGWEEATLEVNVISQAVIPVPESVTQLKEPALFTSYTKEDPVITFLKLLFYAVIAYIFYKIFLQNKSTSVSINRKLKNKYRRY